MKLYTTPANRLAVQSPYYPDFIAGAKKLNGKWNPQTKAWEFDPRDEQRVRDLMIQTYGTDGTTTETTTVTYTISYSMLAHPNPLFAYGRMIAERRSRDSYPVLGEGVIIVEGDFPSSCGSAKYPLLTHSGADVTVEIRDVPISLVK